MNCPYCFASENKVLDKRESEDGHATRRRRECLKCAKRFTTYERIDLVNLTIIKKSGKRESFDKQKLLNGLLRSCEKTNVTRDQIEKAVDEIEAELRQAESTEIDSKVIGNLVMKKLKKLDKIAYIRFASVYREFADLEEFQQELGKLLKK